MLSLYSVSLLPFVLYTTMAILLIWTLFSNVNSIKEFVSVYEAIGSTFLMIGLSYCVSLFISASMTYYIISGTKNNRHKIIRYVLKQLNEMPILMYGLIPLSILSHAKISYYCVYIFIAVPKLTKRWVDCSQKVNRLSLESIYSLGFDSIHAFKLLYFNQYYKIYLGHAVSVFCLLSFVVTPFLCFDKSLKSPMAIKIFYQLGEISTSNSVLILIIIFLFFTKFWIDKKIKSNEIENV
jgi:hypothetical protein